MHYSLRVAMAAIGGVMLVSVGSNAQTCQKVVPTTCCKHPVGVLLDPIPCGEGQCEIQEINPVASHWVQNGSPGWYTGFYITTLSGGCRYKTPTCVGGECQYLGNELTVDCQDQSNTGRTEC